ncbi:red chlorophyll catabolite reductase [Thalictrum thalictroides]|uniref:Red chlorophyll catabolite reductase n=1 Tax=Thalictrum thalictroides TaxID=46969 RepID=A0A7J6WCH9_THATH|nr:red chlorophyll catabolite reductase [Thalictrum thalictroides]
MVVLLNLIQQFQPPLFSTTKSLSSNKSRVVRTSISCSSSSSSMYPQNKRLRFIDLPYLPTPQRNLMVDLVSKMETSLGSQLLPSSLPLDVQYFENESGSSQGALDIRSGTQDSTVDFILGSWIHSKLPSGALNITTLTAYLNNTTDAPRFLIEFIQSSPTSLILILDLPPRKDLILYPDYLTTFYNDTQLDRFRQQLVKLPEIQPYFSSSLYTRSVFSTTAVSIVIDCGTGGPDRMDEIILDDVSPAAKEMLDIWLDKCVCGGRDMEEQERVDLKKRDVLVNKKTLEIDLVAGLPRLFGPDVANRVIEAIQKYSLA